VDTPSATACLPQHERVTTGAPRLCSNADHTPFAGPTVEGGPALALVGGEALVRDSAPRRDPGVARFLPRPRLKGRDPLIHQELPPS
jgi:hypothetical protein